MHTGIIQTMNEIVDSFIKANSVAEKIKMLFESGLQSHCILFIAFKDGK